jgi:hypothetical protein
MNTGRGSDWPHGLGADCWVLVIAMDRSMNRSGDYVGSKHILCLVATLIFYGRMNFYFGFNETVLTLIMAHLKFFFKFCKQQATSLAID